MFYPRLRQDRRIFFPWEGRGGARRFLQVGRVRPLFVVLLMGAFFFWVAARERQAAAERRTRVALSVLRPAVERYLLDHDGACPPQLGELKTYVARAELPLDAWGQSLRLVCPSGRPGLGYELMSDGPDGAAGGLDRIEY